MKTLLTLLSCLVLGIAPATAAAPSAPTLLTIKPTRHQFPREAALRGLNEGYARVVLEVAPDGSLRDFLVTESSDDAFAAEAGRLIRSAEYVPPQDDGPAVACRVAVTVHFRSSGILISTDTQEITEAYLHGRFDHAHPVRLGTAAELDQPPVATRVVKPFYPEELARLGIAGRATVDFYIDTSGHVRLPAIVAEDHAELGDLALAAVRDWQFAPPTRIGEAVATHVTQTFEFTPPQAVAANTKP